MAQQKACNWYEGKDCCDWPVSGTVLWLKLTPSSFVMIGIDALATHTSGSLSRLAGCFVNKPEDTVL